jgi:hypothetical protein
MSVIVGRMPHYYSPLHELLDKYRVYTIRQLCADTGLKSQQGWNLWHGKVGVGRKTALLLNKTYNIPVDELMRLPAVPKPKPTGRGKRRKRSTETRGADE